MAKVNQTKRMIAKMLTTNTGTHMLDSGGVYGRNWERNQGRDFEAEASGTLEFRVYNGSPEIDATLSVYHWLSDRLEYDAKLDRRFYRWATRPSRADDPWLVSAEEFVKHLADHDGREVTGLYGDGDPFTINTYNGEDMLSQTIQYVYFEMDGDPYVLLQIHGGCDVRGGYTRPYAFQVPGDGADIMDNAKGTIYCTGEGATNATDPNQIEIDDPAIPPADRDHYWYTDDTCNWYYQGSAGLNSGTQLEEHEATEDPEERGNGKLYVDDDHNGYCPKCGGKLALGSH
jgi:hypothetical protein